MIHTGTRFPRCFLGNLIQPAFKHSNSHDLELLKLASWKQQRNLARKSCISDEDFGLIRAIRAYTSIVVKEGGNSRKEFEAWLTGSGGGCKSTRQAQQIVRRSFKYLKFCFEDDDEDEGDLSWDLVDFSLSSPNFLFKFVDVMQSDWGLGHAGRLGYLDSISDLIDFRKAHGVASDAVLRNLTATEVYLKRARRTVSKMMRLQWTSDLDIDTALESKGHWATLDELLHVVTYHLPRYETVTKLCKEKAKKATPSDLSFATKFVAVYLFIKVKGSRPMTYQYLTVDMVETAKSNGGFIDQKKFKTTARFGFDSLYLSDTSMQVLDAYITHIRPLLKPTCDYVLVTKKGGQHSKIGQLMSKMVFDATGKYIHPTRYRQIVETASHQQLTSSEQEMISEDQKHSSVVAKVHYQKRRSREVATKAHECLKKLHGEKGSQLDDDVSVRLSESPNSSPNEKQQDNPNESATIKADDNLVNSPKCEKKSNYDQRKKLLLFNSNEDKHLQAGIQRYGFGQWSAILKDPELTFQNGRTANSLLNRAVRKFPPRR
ncbi:hypothetical protein QZH41_001235 [Actinostola sp. cb2023]|nr:hypothetical protein QZH41_001235 [Actinostola sp. cb2023]